jgi:hypothetical protein
MNHATPRAAQLEWLLAGYAALRTLKREEVEAKEYRNLEDLRLNVSAFIDRYYNQERLHSALGISASGRIRTCDHILRRGEHFERREIRFRVSEGKKCLTKETRFKLEGHIMDCLNQGFTGPTPSASRGTDARSTREFSQMNGAISGLRLEIHSRSKMTSGNI